MEKTDFAAIVCLSILLLLPVLFSLIGFREMSLVEFGGHVFYVTLFGGVYLVHRLYQLKKKPQEQNSKGVSLSS